MIREFRGRLPGVAKTNAATSRQALYRGYELEQKALRVGWQVIITKNGAFVRNGSIAKLPDEAMVEAHAYIDSLLSAGA
jgi:alpha-galactosidase/6-phospho-beta-glucosidase family protein